MLHTGHGRRRFTTSLIITGSVAAALFLAPLAPAAGDTLPTDPAPSETAVAVPADTPVPTPTDTPVPAPVDPVPAPVDPVPVPTDPAVPPVAPVAPVPAPVPVPDPDAPPPLVMPAALGSWCETLYPSTSAKSEKRKAQALMAGKVDLGPGGVYYLSQRPNWAPQSGTDTSGDRHVNSLYWALPLLYRGVHKQNPVMVERFRQLMYYWIKDHKGSRAYWVDGSIYGGMRTQALVCAAQTLNEPVLIQAALRDAAKMVSGYRAPPLIAVGANNTDLLRQTGALAAYCWVGEFAARDRAWGNLVGVAHGVVQGDGSDVEGSPGYAMYIEKLLTQVEKSAATCGLQSDNIKALRMSLYSFIAQAVRPDFKLVSLGDTINQSLRGTFGIGDGAAEWIRSAGSAGGPPEAIYSSFDGGYVFGRAGWRPAPGGPDTYYSLRFSSSRPNTPHAHDDGAAMTLYSKGVEWIGDPGPYRYENGSSLRWFMKSRTAHSSFTVTNVARQLSSGVRKLTAKSDWQLGGNDTTCLADNTWRGVSVTRCAAYVRSVDAMIVTDYVRAQKIAGPKKVRKHAPTRFLNQRWQIPPGIGAQNVNDVMTLMAGDKRLDIIKAGAGGWDVRTARSGSSVGWFTGAWGQKLPGAVLSRSVPLSVKGGDQVLVTVFVPRVDGESVPVVIDANGVTITRAGMTITTPLPVPS